MRVTVTKKLRTAGESRVKLFIRRELTFAPHYIPPHEDNEYICARVSKGHASFTMIATYMPPKSKFDRQRLENVLNIVHSTYIIITGDFNSHHHIWGSVRTNPRGRCLADIANIHGLFFLNDKSHTPPWNKYTSVAMT